MDMVECGCDAQASPQNLLLGNIVHHVHPDNYGNRECCTGALLYPPWGAT